MVGKIRLYDFATGRIKAKDKEGKVTVNGVATYIEEVLPELTFKKWNYRQNPQKNLQGMDFPLSLE